MDLEPETRRVDEATAEALRLHELRSPEALSAAREALALAEPLDRPERVAENLYVIGSAALRGGDYSGAEAELRRALALAESAAATSLVGRILRGLLQCAFFTRNLEGAILRGMQALQVARDAGDALAESDARNDLGLLYGNLGDFEGALQHLLSGLRLRRSLAEKRLGNLLNNIGNVYLELGDPREALQFFRSAEEDFRTAGDSRGEATALGNTARAFSSLDDDPQALAAFRASLDAYEAAGFAAYIPPARARLALALAAVGEHVEADETMAAAVEALERSQHQEFRDEVIAAAGRLHLDRGRLDEAIETLGRARALIPEDETSRRVSDLHEALARAHDLLGDPAGALEHYKAYTRVRLAVSDSAIGVRTRGLMLQFDVERARQQEEIFRLRNVELAKANAELQELHEQLEESVRELHRISVEDALTSLHNRRFVDMRLGPEVDRARRYGHPLCAAMCDMDFFKEVNDRFSHAIGDAVLRRVASILLESSRSPDIVSRYGGEEFLLILPETDLEGALALAERVRAGVEQYPWEGLAPGLSVTISIGIARLEEGGTPESLVATADLRLYQAKRVGRNRVFAG